MGPFAAVQEFMHRVWIQQELLCGQGSCSVRVQCSWRAADHAGAHRKWPIVCGFHSLWGLPNLQVRSVQAHVRKLPRRPCGDLGWLWRAQWREVLEDQEQLERAV